MENLKTYEEFNLFGYRLRRIKKPIKRSKENIKNMLKNNEISWENNRKRADKALDIIEKRPDRKKFMEYFVACGISMDGVFYRVLNDTPIEILEELKVLLIDSGIIDQIEFGEKAVFL